MDVRRPEARVVDPGADRVAEQALGLGADEGEAEGRGVGFPDDAVDGANQVGEVLAGDLGGLFRLHPRADVLEEQDDAAHRARRLVPGLHFPAQPDRRAVGEHHALPLDLGRLAGQAAPVGGAPFRLHVGVDVVVAAAEDGLAVGRVVHLPVAVDRDVAHLAVQHRHRARRVVDEELQPLLAVAKAVDDARILRLGVVHRSSVGPAWGSRTAADWRRRRKVEYTTETGTPVDKARSVRYRLAQCPCPPCASITSSTLVAMPTMRAMPTMGPAEVRANSKGHDTPRTQLETRASPTIPARRFFCPSDTGPTAGDAGSDDHDDDRLLEISRPGAGSRAGCRHPGRPDGGLHEPGGVGRHPPHRLRDLLLAHPQHAVDQGRDLGQQAPGLEGVDRLRRGHHPRRSHLPRRRRRLPHRDAHLLPRAARDGREWTEAVRS